MTNKEVIEAMLAYMEGCPNLTTGLCVLEYCATGKDSNIIKQYKPTIKSKFWWQWSYKGMYDIYWWPLTKKGMKKRKEYLEYLLTKFVDY